MSDHTCHAWSCNKAVPPKMFMCKSHWFQLPKPLREAIWANYVPGQEIRKDPTAEYIQTALTACKFIAEREAKVQA